MSRSKPSVAAKRASRCWRPCALLPTSRAWVAAGCCWAWCGKNWRCSQLTKLRVWRSRTKWRQTWPPSVATPLTCPCGWRSAARPSMARLCWWCMCPKRQRTTSPCTSRAAACRQARCGAWAVLTSIARKTTCSSSTKGASRRVLMLPWCPTPRWPTCPRRRWPTIASRVPRPMPTHRNCAGQTKNCCRRWAASGCRVRAGRTGALQWQGSSCSAHRMRCVGAFQQPAWTTSAYPGVNGFPTPTAALTASNCGTPCFA